MSTEPWQLQSPRRTSTSASLADDLHRSDPSNLITRLERRQIHRLPDSIVELHKEAAAAHIEAQRAEARVGVPWERSDELARLRRRQEEIDEKFAASTELPRTDHDAPGTGPSVRQMAIRTHLQQRQSNCHARPPLPWLGAPQRWSG